MYTFDGMQIITTQLSFASVRQTILTEIGDSKDDACIQTNLPPCAIPHVMDYIVLGEGALQKVLDEELRQVCKYELLLVFQRHTNKGWSCSKVFIKRYVQM